MKIKNSQSAPMQYELRLMETQSGTGYFSCIPVEEMNFDSAMEYLRACPNDEFMRKYLIKIIHTWDKDHLKKMIKDTEPADKLVIALLYEACLMDENFNELRKNFKDTDEKVLSIHTPFIYIKSRTLKDHNLHERWIELFCRNIKEHRPLPHPDEAGLPFPFSKETFMGEKAVSIEDVCNKLSEKPLPHSPPRPAPGETIRTALEKLESIGIICEEEMRHVSSLSPIALLRKWQLNLSVVNGRHNYKISGTQTSYGRGLDLEPARAALTMEMVERCSSFAGFDSQGITGYTKEYPLTYGRYSQLLDKEIQPLNPNHLSLEAPYRDDPLYWIEGEKLTSKGRKPLLVPAQCIFLFCNLDEVKLFTGLGSTGLASGNTMEEAKVSALLEIVERDSEGVSPYIPGQCFHLEAADAKLNALLENYLESGIRIQFQDITQPMGVPCCKCFVINQNGEIIKGSGAGLNARKALLSAMTETPYPFPYGSPSNPGLQGLVRVPFENLPDYSLGNPAADLALLEKLLISNGFKPIYVNLTRKDINIPVVRAIIPGMEITGDFDRFSRVHPRLFTNYLNIYK